MLKSLLMGTIAIGLSVGFVWFGESAMAQSNVAPTVVKILEQTKFNADFRYRLDWLKEDVNGVKREARYRHRIRARVGFQTDVDSQWSLGARIATMDGKNLNGGEPVSYNQTLDDNASRKYVGWDLAYFQWKNESGWMVRGGKIVNPIYTPQGSQLIFDMDYTPEGLALQTPWFVTAGYMLDSRELKTGSTTEMEPTAWLWATQAKHQMTVKDRSLLFGAGYYHFFNVKGFTNLYTTNTNIPFLGNTFYSDGGISKYAYGYQVAQLFGEFQPLATLPVTLYADVIRNLAIGRNNFGWIAGAKYGTAAKAKTWDVMYNFRRTESDATMSALNDSDFASGREQAYGHTLIGRYSVTDNVRLALQLSKANIGPNHDDNNERVFLDLNIAM